MLWIGLLPLRRVNQRVGGKNPFRESSIVNLVPSPAGPCRPDPRPTLTMSIGVKAAGVLGIDFLGNHGQS